VPDDPQAVPGLGSPMRVGTDVELAPMPRPR
jgi:hypothetical protein